jgi:hypothetical protein
MCDILASTHGEGEFRHSSEELSTVRIEAAGLGTKRIYIYIYCLKRMGVDEVGGKARSV